MITIATTRKIKTTKQTIKITQRSEFSNEQDATQYAIKFKKYSYCVGSGIGGITGKDISGIDEKCLLFINKFSCRNLPALLSCSL